MTNWSCFPFFFGTVPAGSRVREKSRFRLYSASGVDARVFGAVDFFAATFFVAALAGERFVATRFFAVTRFFAAGFFTARLVAFLVAMRGRSAKTVPVRSHVPRPTSDVPRLVIYGPQIALPDRRRAHHGHRRQSTLAVRAR